MTSRSSETAARSRPSAELISSLRAGKARLREERKALSLPEKIREVLALQRLQYPLIAKQRALRSWEKPWETEP